MKFKMVHENYNVADLERSLAFYQEALGLTEKRRKVTDDFIIARWGWSRSAERKRRTAASSSATSATGSLPTNWS